MSFNIRSRLIVLCGIRSGNFLDKLSLSRVALILPCSATGSCSLNWKNLTMSDNVSCAGLFTSRFSSLYALRSTTASSFKNERSFLELSLEV